VAALLALAAAALVLPLLWRHAWFDSRWTNWIGLVTYKPRTEDFVPLLPWLGPMLLGVVAGRWAAAAASVGRLDGRFGGRLGRALGRGLPLPLLPLAALGRWPLSYYMLHQPVMIGLIMAVLALRAP
jgi:uncharacterized membrane protein